MKYFRERFENYIRTESSDDIVLMGENFDSADLYKLAKDNDAYQAALKAFAVDEIERARERSSGFLRKNGCLDRFNNLAELYPENKLMPWIGAGMSISSGYPGWGEFLRKAVSEIPKVQGLVTNFLAKQQYEEAAECICSEVSHDFLDAAVDNILGSKRRSIQGPIRLLPEIFANSSMITTNLDYNITRLFSQRSRDFDEIISGEKLIHGAEFLNNGKRCLFMIHGEAKSQIGKILTTSQYRVFYKKDTPLNEVLEDLIGHYSLLFLGASLSYDRTVKSLESFKAKSRIKRPRHYAFLQYIKEEDARLERLKELGNWGIHPIWYPDDGNHDQHIEDLLFTINSGPFHE